MPFANGNVLGAAGLDGCVDTASPRIVLFAVFEPVSPGSAAELHVSRIASGLAEDGWKLCIAGLEPSRKVVQRLRGMIHILGGVLRSEPGSVLYVRMHPLALPFLLLARLRRLAIVVEVNGHWSDAVEAHPRLRPVAGILRALTRMSLRTASGIIAVTQPLLRWCLDEVGDAELPACVIPAGVDPEALKVGPQPRTRPMGNRVLFFGALAEWQGLRELIAATSHVNWPPNCILTIAGVGPLESLIRTEVVRVPERIEYLGQRSRSEIAELLNGSVASVSAKTYAPTTGLFPIKVIESMAAGTPVIVNDVPDQNRLVLESGAGVVISQSVPELIAGAVASLVQLEPDDWQRVSECGTLAAVNHTWEHRVSETSAFLATVQAFRRTARGRWHLR